VSVGDQALVLVPNRNDLYAVPSVGPIRWQFPPDNKDSFALSEQRQRALRDQVAALEAEQDAKDELNRFIDELTVGGDSVDAMNDAIDAAQIPEDARPALKDAVDDATDLEKRAIDDIRALYGDIALSEDTETAYVSAFGGWVFALNTDTGEARWVVETDGPMVGGVEYDAQEDVVYFGSRDGTLEARDAGTGERRWSVDVGGDIWATPTLANGSLYVTSMEGEVHRFSRDAETEWVFDGADAGIASRVSVADGRAYVGAFDDRLYALDAESGDELWTLRADNWFWTTPLLDNGVVYAASLDGKVYAADAESGERRWSFDTGEPVRSTPVIVRDALVVAARNGEVFKLDLGSGDRIASAEVTAGSRVEADLATNGDATVYVVPRRAALVEVDVSGDEISAGSIPLNQ
jgi:outer membrane protein assembly factor BamB